jgi:hypothetical protein
MTDEQEPRYLDSSRLKQVNLELGHLKSKHKACRLNSGIFSIVGAVLLAVSLLGLIHLLPAGANDWTQNPDSPVYAIAAQEESLFKLKAIMVVIGFATGLGLLYFARLQCSRQSNLWQREGDLLTEMRELRDRLYVVDQVHSAHEHHPERHTGPTAPLDPDDARGEYVGVYNPPASHRDHDPNSTAKKD